MMKPLILHVPLSEKILFARHLALMVRTGATLLDGLRLIEKQMRSASFRYILAQAVRDVEGGKFLSASLGRFQRVFGELFINIIRVGEASGSLSENLSYLAVELRKRQALRQKVRAALIYPAAILTATLGIVGILVFFVLPRILPIFSSLRITLPLSTRVLIAVSQVLLNYGVSIFIGLIILGAIWMALLRLPDVRFQTHRLILFLPFLGSVSQMANISDITRTLGLLLKSGTQIVEGVRITAGGASNLVYRRALEEVAEEIKRGESLHTYLARHEHLFPPTMTYMIEVGEATGSLEGNLFYLADYYADEVEELTKTMTSVLEPVLLLAMGALVGFVAIAIITPIYQVTQTLGR